VAWYGAPAQGPAWFQLFFGPWPPGSAKQTPAPFWCPGISGEMRSVLQLLPPSKGTRAILAFLTSST
jgi:hypothetical protein